MFLSQVQLVGRSQRLNTVRKFDKFICGHFLRVALHCVWQVHVLIFLLEKWLRFSRKQLSISSFLQINMDAGTMLSPSLQDSMKRRARRSAPTIDVGRVSESPTTAVTPSPHAVRGPVLAEELRDLSNLHSEGDLSQIEYSAAKTAVIGIASPGSSTTPPTMRSSSAAAGSSSLKPPTLSPTAPPPNDQIILLQRENAGLKSTVNDLMNRLSRKVNVTKLMDEVNHGM